MLSRHNWITEFIGHVLRRGLSDDPDWAFDTAGEVYPEMGGLEPNANRDPWQNAAARFWTSLNILP